MDKNINKQNIPSPHQISFSDDKVIPNQPKEKIYKKPSESEESISIKKNIKLPHDTLSTKFDKPLDDKNIYDLNNKPINSPIKSSQLKDEINNNINNKPIKSDNKSLKLFFKIIITFIFSLILIYIVVNFNALIALATFEPKDNSISEYIGEYDTKDVKFLIPEMDDLVFLPIIMGFPKPDVVEFPPKEEEKVEEPAPEEPAQEVAYTPPAQSVSTGVANTLNNQLLIPSLGISVPVVWGSPVDENTMLANLQHGVVNYLGTAKPGEGLENNTGNVFISGHSSYYSWDPGQYNSIFATLPNINIGDQVAIGYNDKVYVYQVYDKTEVSPSDVDVVRQDTDKHIVTLMTCVPVGTNERRFIARAEFVGYAE